MFYVQINGEALWQWRNLETHDQVFNNLQDGLMKFGYKLSSSSCPRVGTAVYRRVQYLAKKARNIKNSDTRKAMRSQYWCKVALHPDEIVQGPDEIIRQLQQKEEENVRLRNELEGKKVYCVLFLIYNVR